MKLLHGNADYMLITDLACMYLSKGAPAFFLLN